MNITHHDRELGWAGVLFGLLDLNGSPVFVTVNHLGGITVHLEGELNSVSHDDADDSISLDLVTHVGDFTGSVAIDRPEFERGHWYSDTLVIFSATTSVWITPLA